MRVLLRMAAVLGSLVALVLMTVAGVWIWLRTEAGQRWGLRQLLTLVQPELGVLTVDTLRTDLWSTARVEGVRIHDNNGKELLGLDTIDAEFSLGGLLSGALRVSRLNAAGLRADLTLDEAGVDIANLWGTASAPVVDSPYAGLGLDIYVDGIEIEAGSLVLSADAERYGVTSAQLSGGLHLIGDRVVIERLVLNGTGVSPELGDLSLRGGGAWSPATLFADTIELSLGRQHVTLSGALDAGIATEAHLELEELPWDLPVYGTFAIAGNIAGSMEAPKLDLLVTTPGGRVDLLAALDMGPARPAWSATVVSDALALHTFVDVSRPIEFSHSDPTPPSR